MNTVCKMLLARRLFYFKVAPNVCIRTLVACPSASEGATESSEFGSSADDMLACCPSEKCVSQPRSYWTRSTKVFRISKADWLYQGLRNASPAS